MVEFSRSFREAREAKRARQDGYHRRFEAGLPVEDDSIVRIMGVDRVRFVGSGKLDADWSVPS